MRFYADLHVHSKYSRATSQDCDLENLAYWARKKGIHVVGTGDFTHPAWRVELQEKLVPAEPGLFRLRPDLERAVNQRLQGTCQGAVRFMLSVELSTIYTKAKRTYRIHHLVYAPDFASVDHIIARLLKAGANLKADGRPIMGLDSRHVLEIVLESGPGSYLVPAHVWTPWFAVLGSNSGFDRVADCYADLADHIFAIETGLSSDPAMNWRVSQLDRYTLVSNSDAHSPAKLGREACVFESELDYFAMRRALETRTGFGGTLEFYPEEGKYHLDGHRSCGVVLEPEESRARNNLCPVCGQKVTVGVLHRVEALADRPEGYKPDNAIAYRSLVPLPEIIAEITRTGPGTKAVARGYEELLGRFGPEFAILDELPVDELERRGAPQIAEAVARMRAGKVTCKPGFDGEYGVVRLFRDAELGRRKGKAALSLALPGMEVPAVPPMPQRPEDDEQQVSARASQATAPGAGSGDAEEAPRPPASRAGRAEDTAAGPGLGGASSTLAGQHSGWIRGGDDESLHEEIPATGLLAGLDPEQRAAASVTEGPLLIIAGPGTGKTRTLTHRIAHLIADKGVAPESCLAITFTNRAAQEMRERLAALLPDQGERVPVMTFHALALAILKENRLQCGLHRGFRVATDDERMARLARIFDYSERKARRMLAEISTIKRTGTAVDPDSAVAQALEAYRAALEAEALIDFDDLLLMATDLLSRDAEVRAGYRRRFRWISIDEYQDIDELQYRLVRLLCPDDEREGERESESGSEQQGPAEHARRSGVAQNLCAIGDPDQAIYGFRGADVGFFLRFQQDFPAARRVQLGRNYRSTRTIVDAALQAIRPSSLVADRRLIACSEQSGRIELIETASERAEAELVVHSIERLMGGTSFFSIDSGRVSDSGRAGDSRRVGGSNSVELSFADFAVLYRSEAQVGPLIEAFARSGIPFQHRGHQRIADRPGVAPLLERVHARRDVILGRTLILALREAAAELYVDAEPETRNTVESALELLLPLALHHGDDVDGFLAALACGVEVDTWDPRADRVSLLTMHAAKGLEFRVVFLVGCEDGIVPLRWGRARPGRPAWDEDAQPESGESADSAEGAQDGEIAQDTQDAQDAQDIETAEERRLFFVGVTRAKELLYLTWARKRTWRGQVRETAPSPFLADIDRELLLESQRSAARTRKKTGGKKHEQLGLF